MCIRDSYEAMQGLPVTIRFLDPPLHEFVPHTEEEIKELSEEMHISVEEIHNVIDSLHEFNPMMGHRGCRLAVSYPEIAEMQTTAVIRAAINVGRKHPDWEIVPEIMIPLVGEVKELAYVKGIVCKAVSYTHLDVYKRQPSGRQTLFGLNARPCLESDTAATIPIGRHPR